MRWVRRPVAVLSVVVAAAWAAGCAAAADGEGHGDLGRVQAAAPPSSVSEPVAAPTPTTTAPPSTTVAPATTAAVPDDVLGALAALAVRREHGEGYDRDAFDLWVDDDGDGCDTRQEVLAAERLAHGAGACGLIGATWYSPYDGGEYHDPADLEIDHLVALKEAWDSGAWAWTDAHRRAFANDLGHPEALIAVASHENRAKGDRDPSNWMPTERAAWCGYAADWVRVKAVWGLSVDGSEAGRLRVVLEGCGAEPGTLVGARPDPSRRPLPTAPPTTPTTLAVAPTEGCHPSYDPCVPVASDVDCAGGRGNGPAYTGRVRVIGPDVYELDGDGDGIACDAA